jgi:hypothetical protein
LTPFGTAPPEGSFYSPADSVDKGACRPILARVKERYVHGEYEDRGEKGVRVKAHHLVPAVLVVFIAELASAAVGESLHESTGIDEMHHSKGSSCPDPANDEDPCGPTCPCTCCPGHLTATAIALVHPFIAAQLTDELEAMSQRALYPKEVLDRVFRPPRA